MRGAFVRLVADVVVAACSCAERIQHVAVVVGTAGDPVAARSCCLCSYAFDASVPSTVN